MPVIPTNRQCVWTGNVGVPPTIAAAFPGTGTFAGTNIPNRTTIFADVTQSPYNCDKTGVANASPGLQSAINACPANQVVFIPAGTYSLDTSLSLWKQNITIRGAGDTTILSNRGGVTIFNLGPGTTGAGITYSQSRAWTGGYAPRTSIITVANTTNLSVGQMIALEQLDDLSLIWSSAAATPTVANSGSGVGTVINLRELKRITAINGNQLTIDTPLVWNQWSATFSPTVSTFGDPSYQSVGVGLESFKIDGSPSQAVYSVLIAQAYGCWMKDVWSYNNYGYHTVGVDIARCEFRRNRWWLSQIHSSNCGGLLFQTVATSNLVEDNIFLQMCPSFEIDTSALGNAFLYNFSDQAKFVLPEVIQAYGLDGNHFPHGAMNLWEGNYSNNYLSDAYYGSHSHDTIFRNRLHGVDSTGLAGGIKNSRCVDLCRWSLFMSVVGNILGSAGWSTVFDQKLEFDPYESGIAFIYRFGFPNLGNGSYTGVRPSMTYTADFAQSMQAKDLAVRPTDEWNLDENQVPANTPGSVQGTTIVTGNWDAIHGAVQWDSGGIQVLPSSYYYSAKPSYFNSLAWPPFDPLNPGSTGPSTIPASGSVIPSGYRFNNNNQDPPAGGVTTINATVVIK